MEIDFCVFREFPLISVMKVSRSFLVNFWEMYIQPERLINFEYDAEWLVNNGKTLK